ncbi:MAG TPA: hypothetical protein VEK38_00225 [Candidatus Bathyarchaeia archaeon]|nr:hypothetical protein [Candidatus Bathyarchaeia archaeon]
MIQNLLFLLVAFLPLYATLRQAQGERIERTVTTKENNDGDTPYDLGQKLGACNSVMQLLK